MYILLAMAAGAGLALQAVINTRLRTSLDSALWAAIVQTLVGLTLLGVVVLAVREPPPLSSGLSRLPWWVWTGGILGAAYVVGSIVATRPLGAALMIASVIVGQTVGALIIDHYGWLGVDVQRLTFARLAGALLMFGGLLLIRR